MEVEVKLSLPDNEAHSAVLKHLKAKYQSVHTLNQEDFFFDGVQQELSTKNVILRIRFFNETERCVLALKGKAVIESGVSRAFEEEEDIRAATGRAIVADPNQLLQLDSDIVRKVHRDYRCGEVVGLGGFQNVRRVFDWEEGLNLEVDETRFDFGVAFEIECETSQPEEARSTLEQMLIELKVPYAYSKHSKFHKFHVRSLCLEE